ncbi:type II toxin-antitoxin system RelE family toxin [Carnobacterium maltaromaticum]|uniref:type II toxin-antitoxin system RelE family toxin n=1 Tax=Carnobacterium maltaromaticum TaxID=2751 RepID=UPI00191B996A|nr:type II toxin-antitoxin system RelE/ParE family toxin [Carnobacterium maltaromaticum]CAD5898211.1 Plasmid stabilisation system protein [Carnobacterium maltaromaticum]
MNKKYKVEFGKDSQKVLKKMDKYQASLIMGWIKKNLVDCENPYSHGKALVANHNDKWCYRIGDYRLVVNIEEELVVILILTIGHRKDIYKKL